MLKLAILFLLTISFLLNPGKIKAEITWTETMPTGAALNGYWTALASDADGSNLIVSDGNYGGKLYISNDGGSSWTETIPATLGGSQWWNEASLSADGSKMIVTSGEGRVYISNDGGDSWIETMPTGSAVNKWWTALAADEDISNIIVSNGDYNGKLYVSSDGGSSWNETVPAILSGNRYWEYAVSSADGSRLVVTVNSGRIYVSTNGGISWTETFPTGVPVNADWTALASDADGSNLIVSDGNYGGKLYISNDGGSSWTETIPATLGGSQWWGSASSNVDGSKLIVTSSPGRFYTSSNGGSSWTETMPTGVALNGYWKVLMADDGSHMIAANSGGRIYVGTNLPDHAIPEEAPTSPPSSEEISTVIESNNNASDPNVIPGWSLPIMAGPNFTGLHGFIPNTNISSDESRLASIFIDRYTHHDDLNINHSDFNWLNILMFWNNPDEVKLPWTQGFNTVSEISKIEAKSSFNGYPVTELDNPYIILLGYNKASLGKIDQSKLKIARFNESTKKWETIKGSYVYPDGKIATVTNKFGYFSVVYPRSWWGSR